MEEYSSTLYFLKTNLTLNVPGLLDTQTKMEKSGQNNVPIYVLFVLDTIVDDNKFETSTSIWLYAEYGSTFEFAAVVISLYTIFILVKSLFSF